MKADSDATTLYGDGTARQVSATYTIDEISRWNQIWPQAVAMAWSDPAFKKDLLADPRDALVRHLGYRFPDEITLEVKDAAGIEGVTTEGQPAKAGYYPPSKPGDVGHWLVPATNVTLWLPGAPDTVEMQGVALATYGTRGHIYPFTCCC